MRLSRHSDYALRLLMLLAVRDCSLSTISEIAERYRISKSHLMKVAQDLTRLGVVQSVRGRSGGLRLGRDASDIRVGEIVRHLEPDFAVVECLQESGGACLVSPACRLKHAFREASQAFVETLDRYSLADLVSRNDPLADLLGMEAQA